MKLLILFFSFFFFIACSSKNVDYDNNILLAIKDIDKETSSKDFKYVFLIPNAGCPGCTSSAESFLLMYAEDSSIIYVLTDFQTVKGIEIKLGSDILQKDNVLVDINNSCNGRNIRSFYPIIYYLEDGVITKVDTVSPKYPNSIANLESVILNTSSLHK